jgi:phage-related minor tail protein
MGERGPEAVMPLTRTSGGDLGVKSEGDGAAVYNININALDSQSFSEFADRNSAAFINQITKGIRLGHRDLIGKVRMVAR